MPRDTQGPSKSGQASLSFLGQERLVHIENGPGAPQPGRWNNIADAPDGQIWGTPVNGVVEINANLGPTTTPTSTAPRPTPTPTPTPGSGGTWSSFLDYSGTRNPNGAWSYGRKRTVEGTALDLMRVNWAPCAGWRTGERYHPAMQCGLACGYPIDNPTCPDLWAADNSNGYPVVRWTAPSTGSFDVDGTFTSEDSRGNDLFGYVVVNGSLRFQAHIIGYPNSVPYSFHGLVLQAGEVIDFVIVWNDDAYYHDQGWTSAPLTIRTSAGSPRGAAIRTTSASAQSSLRQPVSSTVSLGPDSPVPVGLACFEP